MHDFTPKKMKYFQRGERIFTVALSYFLTWYNALQLTSYGPREWLLLVWAFLINLLITGLLLLLIVSLTHRPIFGQSRAYYYPMRTMIPVAMMLSFLYALLCWAVDDQPLTGTHLLVYLAGYILGVGVILLTFWLQTRKK